MSTVLPSNNDENTKIISSSHFVLVHGAGHGAWCWYKVANLLQSTGHKVTTIDLTASGINPIQVTQVNGSLVDYAKPLMDFMASLPSSEAAEEVVLVGHSLGGLSISLAMESFPHKISAAVFVTALMPGPNLTYHNIYQENTRRFGSPMDSTFIYGQGPNNPPTAVLFGPNLLASKFYQLSPPEDLVLALTLLRPYDQFSNEELLSEQLKLTKEKYGSVRRVFIVCDQDYVIEESMQRWMIEKNPPHEVMVINQTDHMVMFSNPLMLFSHLEQIACTPNILT
uniref:(S)-hydroxynitrile lyase n=1 Tax=Cannabis sativa TaxID=3483 RepID=A0A803PF26_CANSA